jgi:hypothetical protein
VREDGRVVDGDEARFGRRPSSNHVAVLDGFNLHAAVVISADDREGRERLLRYVARPMVAGDRVSELEDGRIAWRLKYPGSRGETHRLMEPMEFMARPRCICTPFAVARSDRSRGVCTEGRVRRGRHSGGGGRRRGDAITRGPMATRDSGE